MKAKYFISSLVLIIITITPSLLSAQGVNINGGLQVVANGPINLVVDNGNLKNDGIFKADSSTVIFDGGANAAVITGSNPTTFHNLTFRGSGTKANNSDASVLATLAATGTTVFDADGVSNNRAFTLKSSDTATANVDILTTGDIAGNVTVERFINTGINTGEHGKSWQFLATPTTGQTFFQSWQEGGTVPAGYGTWVTGTGTGFDATTASPSLKFYNPATNGYTAVTNTGGPLQNKLGYMLFVRGDRSVTVFNAPANNTNMRSKGVLFTAVNPPPSVAVTANLFQTFGNPYASRIEFNKVYLASTGINDVFYAWDPNLSGTLGLGLGGFQTMTGITGYIPTAGSGTAYYPAGVPSPYIESGQAVFVQGNGVGGNVNFNENCKVGGNRLVNKGPEITENTFPNRQFLFTTLFTNTGLIADGNIVAFETGFSNELNDYDALKLLNPGENFGIKRNGSLLAVEARDPVNINDTIFYDMKNLKQQAYELRFAPVNMSNLLTAYLVDKYNNSHTIINLTDSNFINFTVNAEDASAAADRFMLVFKKAIVVPVTFVHLSALRNTDQTINVNWKVANEINLQRYEVERSVNGQDFNAIGNTSPLVNNGGNATYPYRDENPFTEVNFYRIKAVNINGDIRYSNIVKVVAGRTESSIAVYPNPVIDKTIHISFKNQQQGNYTIQITNKAGQMIHNDVLYIDQANIVHTVKPKTMLTAGTYQLSIVKADGTKIIEQVFVK